MKVTVYGRDREFTVYVVNYLAWALMKISFPVLWLVHTDQKESILLSYVPKNISL